MLKSFVVKKRMEPIALDKFSNYVQEMHKDRDFGFETEYAVSSTNEVSLISVFYYSCIIFCV